MLNDFLNKMNNSSQGDIFLVMEFKNPVCWFSFHVFQSFQSWIMTCEKMY